jgi:hypothetical protein
MLCVTKRAVTMYFITQMYTFVNNLPRGSIDVLCDQTCSYYVLYDTDINIGQ